MNTIHECLVEEPGLGPGCCRLCPCSCSRDTHISKKVKDQKDQPTSANVWDITVSISEIPRHELLLGTKENLAISTFSAFSVCLFFLSKVRNENSPYCLLKYIIAV